MKLKRINPGTRLQLLVFIAVNAIVILTFLQGLLKDTLGFSHIGPIETELIDEIIIASTTFLLMLTFSILRKGMLPRFPYLGHFCLVVAHFIISALINGRSIIISVISLRDTFQYLLFFWILFFFFSFKEYKKTFNLIIGLLLIQVPFILYQYIVMTGTVDRFGGTMGQSGSHILSLSMGIGAIYFVAKWIYSGKIRYIFMIMLAVIIILFASYRTMMLMLPFLSILFFYKLFQLGRRRSILIAITFSLLVVSIKSVLWIFGFNYTLVPKTLVYQQTLPAAGRIMLLSYTTNLILEKPYTIIWGIGPGYYVSKTAKNLVDSPYSRELSDIINPAARYSMQYPITLGETGLIGLVLIIVLFIRIFLKIYRGYNGLAEEYKPILLTTLMSIVLYLGCGVSGNVFEWQESSLILWFFIAYSHRILTLSTTTLKLQRRIVT